MIVNDIIKVLENYAPPMLQENYDNSGLILGNNLQIVEKVLICVDVTEEVVDEAISKQCNLIISHHPIIFKGLKKINGKNYVERAIIKSIQNQIAIYAIHTNLDNVIYGVNSIFAEKLGLKNIKVLEPKNDFLFKLVTFCPYSHADIVRQSIFEAGAGKIGKYDSCSYNVDGEGTFKALENANPFVGELNKLHTEKEVRIETIFPKYLQNDIINALMNSHPYEEVAYDIYPLVNTFNTIGSGLIGEIEPIDELDFLKKVKIICENKYIRHSELLKNKINKVAICGGSGSFLIQKAIQENADVILTGDIKYHDFFEADKKIVIADIGHYESEQFVKELINTIINKNFPNFAVEISKMDINPIYYL